MIKKYRLTIILAAALLILSGSSLFIGVLDVNLPSLLRGDIELFMGLSIAAMITASVVVVVGSISYIGLIVPNLVAMFKGDKIRGTLVDTALFGSIFVLACDMIGRSIIAPYELPIELIIGIVGSIVFIAMLLYRLNHGRKAIRLGGKAREGRLAAAVMEGGNGK